MILEQVGEQAGCAYPKFGRCVMACVKTSERGAPAALAPRVPRQQAPPRVRSMARVLAPTRASRILQACRPLARAGGARRQARCRWASKMLQGGLMLVLLQAVSVKVVVA